MYPAVHNQVAAASFTSLREKIHLGASSHLMREPVTEEFPILRDYLVWWFLESQKVGIPRTLLSR